MNDCSFHLDSSLQWFFESADQIIRGSIEPNGSMAYWTNRPNCVSKDLCTNELVDHGNKSFDRDLSFKLDLLAT